MYDLTNIDLTGISWSQYLYLLVKVRTCRVWYVGRGSGDDVAIPIPSGEGQNLKRINYADWLKKPVSQYLYLLVKVRTSKTLHTGPSFAVAIPIPSGEGQNVDIL